MARRRSGVRLETVLVRAVQTAAREAERNRKARIRQTASQQRAWEAESRRQEKERQANLRKDDAIFEKNARRAGSLVESINNSLSIAKDSDILSTRLSQTKTAESNLIELKALCSQNDGRNNQRAIRIENLAEWESELEEIKSETRLIEFDEQRQQKLIANLQEQAEGAAMRREALQKTLLHTLDIDDAIVWEQLKDYSVFNTPRPAELPHPVIPKKPTWTTKPAKPKLKSLPPKPDRRNARYRIAYSLLYILSRSAGHRQRQRKIAAYRADYRKWCQNYQSIKTENATVQSYYEAAVCDWEMHKQRALVRWILVFLQLTISWKTASREQIDQWERDKLAFLTEQQRHNEAMDSLQQRYASGQPGAIAEYCGKVLERSQYPEDFPQQFDLHYQPDNKMLVVEYMFPAMEVIPTLKAAQYIKSTDKIKESHITQKQVQALFDDLLYQIALRSIHELFEADVKDALESVVFNGLARLINKGTGKEETRCILSLQASKAEFLQINLEKIEPKDCFRALKGVASSQLHGLTPIAPILQLNKEDKRFIEAVSVSGTLDEGVNLAAMDWQSFEYLVREIFAQEFNASGGEVKVTQSSRDGGVDAIAFDPDPIRGGKIVIQAKRYTNVVGVSAVRDLYGTVLNEGASKGILITTAYFGTDAYEFAKNKPITLLNGSNLLHLLEKHGTKARINLSEAKASL